MEKPPVNTTNNIESPKAEESIEHFLLSEQEKDIQEVFKLNPELQKIALEAIGFDEQNGNKIVRLYRIENRVKKIQEAREKGNHDKYIGQWFTTDLSYAIDYIENTYNKNDGVINYNDTVLLYREMPVSEASEYLLKKDKIVAEKLEAEPDNFHISDRSKIESIDLGDILASYKQGKIIRTKFGFDKKELEPLIQEKIKDLTPVEATFEDVVSFEKQKSEAEKMYAKYLATIFPESKIRDIVWHGTTNPDELKIDSKFEFRQSKEFGYSHNAFFATSSIEDSKTGGTGKGEYTPVALLLDITQDKIGVLKDGNVIKKNTDRFNYNSVEDLQKDLNQYSQQWEKSNWKVTRTSDTQLFIEKPDSIVKRIGVWKEENLIKDLSNNLGYLGDIKEATVKELQEKGVQGVVIEDAKDLGLQGVGNKKWYIVFKPEQIHILGSKADIEKFKKFVSRNEDK